MSSFLKNIAIVGAGGQIGGVITQALLTQGKHNVTAISRPDSKATMPSGLTAVKKANYDDHEQLVESLRGQDVLIITMSVTAAPDTSNKLIDAASDAGVKYVIPSEWGMDDGHQQMTDDYFVGPGLRAVRQHIESKGNLHWIAINNSFWYEFSLAGTELRYGFDFDKRSVTFYDDGNTKITTSTWNRVGLAVAKLLALPEKPTTEGGPSLSDWANDSLKIGSFYISQRDMFDSVLRVTNTQEKDWTIKHEGAKERYQRGLAMFGGSEDPYQKFLGFGVLMYARAFFPDDPAEFQSKLQDKIIGLEDEDLDTATRRAVQMAKESSGQPGTTLK